MTLFGSLNSSVSGLSSQGSKIAMIADNISNVNTVGYKAVEANFNTLVTSSSTTTAFSSGGVLALTRTQIDKQGLIQGTGVVTDLAISGDGFFVVNSQTDGSGDTLYTRAGSFRTDSRGNFVNAAGFTLFGWPVDSDGRLPGEAGNLNTTSNALLDSLRPININSISGVAASTSKVNVGMNLDASQAVLEGAGDTVDIPQTSLENRDNNANSIILDGDGGALSSGNTLAQGEGITVTTGGQTFTYTYGGIETGFDIDTVTGGILGSTLEGSAFTAAGDGDSFTITTPTLGTNTFTFKPSSPNAVLGEFNSLDNLVDAINNINGLSARIYNGVLQVSPTNASEAMTFARVGGTPSSIASGDLTTTAVLGATTAALDFTSATTGDGITIHAGNVIETFTYDPAGTAGAGVDNLFQNLNELAAQINSSFGAATATVAGGVLTIVNPTIGGDDIKYIADSNGAGTSNFATALNIRYANIPDAIGLSNTAAASNRFSTLGGLADLINNTAGLTAIVENPLDATTVQIYADDPLADIQFANTNGANDFLAEFGLTNTALTGAYDPADDTKNIAGGAITPHFSRNVRFFDSIGTGHDFQLSFVKLGANTWGAEIYAINDGDIVTSRSDGLVASGTVVFNGDGSLRSVSNGLTTAIDISWENLASANSVTFDWGIAGQISGTLNATAIGQTNGLRQFDSDFNVEFVEQNGVSAGLLSAISIDENGFIIANFSNGESRNIFKIALADFANPNGLTPLAGNVYRESNTSGNFNLREPGISGGGKITPAALETANVDLATELTQMIIAQRGYQASSKVITTVDDLLDELNRI
ncbi:MAG: flagellar hook-basal body complex protein [Rickettsiales bacterium]|jgi:flagellar hook protein FlgE|nr:flagellar hook-basal body complex protein [Rickettsiales bacterium]